MSESWTSIIVALIGLGGTLLAAYIGYRQWSRGRQDATRQDAIKTKREIYEGLWRLVEKTHIDLRTNPSELSHLPGRIATINAYVLENEIYLADGDHQLVNQYVVALGQMMTWARKKGDPTTQALLHTTADIPREATAVVRAFDLRDQLKERVRRAVQGS